MSAIQKLLTDHIGIWTAADTEKKSGRGRSSGNAASVYGIKKLRELILELALRGKLVSQDPNDEPASELLRRLGALKTAKTAEGKIKKDKSFQVINDLGRPFDLPDRWEWVKFNDLISPEFPISYGVLVPGNNEDGGVPFVRIADLDINSPPAIPEKSISKSIDDQYQRTRLEGGEILMGVVGSIGKLGIAPKSWKGANIARAICRIKVSEQLNKKYIVWLLQSQFMQNNFRVDTKTLAQPTLNISLIRLALTPLPPLAEQHRIVAKVDELMALCDQLEAQHINAADAHEKLVSHLLGTLTESQSAADFNDNWQRIAAHFDTLFTTEASIDALKQTLLQLAVMGKLVPQDPKDEPASELLKRIQAEKAKLVSEGKIKKEKPALPISDEERRYNLPEGWEWVPLSEVITPMDSGWSPACLANSSPSESVWGVLKTTAVQVLNYLEHENKELPTKLKPRPESEVKVGDILFTRAGPTNRVAISCYVQRTRKKLMISDKIIRFHPLLIDGRFLALCLNGGATAEFLEKAKSGMAASQVNISQEKLRVAPIPIAPLRLQLRIVATVDELMEQCEHLKLRLNRANVLQQKISDVMAGQAIAQI